MPEYSDENTITIFKNDKRGNPKAPALWGKVNIEGVWYKVALWQRDGKSGPFWSGTVQSAEDERNVPQRPSQRNPGQSQRASRPAYGQRASREDGIPDFS